ncbi:MAG: tetratricopeptide repeat protein [Thermodesulfobacteriota bacterium]
MSCAALTDNLSRDRRGRGLLFGVVLLLCLLGFAAAPSPAGAAGPSEDELREVLRQRQEKLWQDANDALRLGKDEEAAQFFLRYYQNYSPSPLAEDALWQTAQLHRELALGAVDPDWQTVMDLYRSYTLEFPDSPRQAEAYFYVAGACVNMGYQREALTYYGLFVKKFPADPLVDEARFMRARILLRLGRLDEAAAVYEELGLSMKPLSQLRAEAGMAHIAFARGQYHDALAAYLKILKKDPTFYVHDPDLLRNKGIASLRVDDHQGGRRDLLHYLNIAGFGPSRPEVLFELAESYLAEGKAHAAATFYRQIVAEGQSEDREVVLSRFRLAGSKKPAEESADTKGKDAVGSPADDQPVQAVLDTQYADPLSQEARLEMLRRHWQRGELEQAFAMGKAYLRHQAAKPNLTEVEQLMGDILVRRMEGLLEKSQYAAIYQLYQDEQDLVASYRKARLLYLVGRALEEMAVYRQASVLYYRAMALAASDEELLELYVHRALTYLAGNDLKSAQRLLKYLRKVYASSPALGEICWLSGQLRERQQRPADALEFYKIAVESPTYAGKKAVYAADYLRLLFDQDAILDRAGVLKTFVAGKWLPPAELQQWYGRLGDRYRAADDPVRAAEAYGAALADGMPLDGEGAQLLRLRLGDMLFRQGKKTEAGEQFQKAAEGPDDLVKKMAQQRLRQESIMKSMAETEAVLKK